MRRLFTLLALVVVGCGVSPAPGEPSVEVGSGEAGYEALVDGQDVDFIAGSQGGHHIWLSLRTIDVDPARVDLRIEIQPVDGSMPMQDSWNIVRFDAMEGTHGEYIGWPAVIADPGCFVDREVRVRVIVEGEGGVAIADKIVVPQGDVRACGAEEDLPG